MESYPTRNGTLCVGSIEEIFRAKADFIRQAAENAEDERASIGLTGGSTPKAWYPWAVEQGVFTPEVLENLTWCVSDERCVPLDDDASNFGHAARGLLDPLGVPDVQRMPWNPGLAPADASEAFLTAWGDRFGPTAGFDLCILGMGDDCHLASIFPGSPLIGAGEGFADPFTAIDVPGKGWRLTVTEFGLAQSKQIIQIITGAGKAKALKQVLQGPVEPFDAPSQILANWAGKVTLLVDPGAASQLDLSALS